MKSEKPQGSTRDPFLRCSFCMHDLHRGRRCTQVTETDKGGKYRQVQCTCGVPPKEGDEGPRALREMLSIPVRRKR